MGMIPAMNYMNLSSGANTTGGSLWLAPDDVVGWSMTVTTTGTLTGAFKFYASDDPRARQDHPSKASATWTEFTSDVSSQISNPAGSTTTFKVMVSNFRSDFMRMDYAHTSGAGTVIANFSGHGA